MGKIINIYLIKYINYGVVIDTVRETEG